ncbi:MAG TPA: S-methyl-5-thioribose-1-phosphate isomerase [Anaerolineales bacterium]|nr:S-methyl-5-thioribose-1-phosphate isomerase [Anaerolineales bacterium]
MRTVWWDPAGPTLHMIDQRQLPAQLTVLALHTPEAVADAIRSMAVRGAPAIGVAAAFGLALAAAFASDPQDVVVRVDQAAELLRLARPKAANLRWAIDETLRRAGDRGSETFGLSLAVAAQALADEDVAINRQMGLHGADLLKDGDTVLHHCNTGALATVDYGTALGVIRTAHEQGKHLHVLVDETRPRLQGARLTAWELDQHGIDHAIIADSAAGRMLQQGEVNAVLVGADRVAANGDVANKIGTYMVALAAHDNRVPFYCVVPTSTVDPSTPDGAAIPIEERDPQEVLDLIHQGQQVAPEGSRALNPAFDITPARLVTAFVTEVGILRPPYPEALAKVRSS